jgi:hypothetical protein
MKCIMGDKKPVYHMTIRPRSRAPIKNNTEKSRDGACTGLDERAVKSRPAQSKGIRPAQVLCVCVCFLNH